MDRKDIDCREDLLLLLNAFYEKAIHDEVIGHFFTTVIQLDLNEHIPVITDFWETVLLHGNSYKKNAMIPHKHLNQLSEMKEAHFNRWLQLFTETVDAFFEGEMAERAKQRAISIATIMRINVSDSSKLNFTPK